MKNRDIAEDWLKRAKSNLARVRVGKVSEEILYEDICFDAQQCAEKVLKAFLVSLDATFPRTHSIDVLLQLVSGAGIEVPQNISESVSLTRYAVHTRYPGISTPVSEEEYEEALKLAETVFEWVSKIIKENADATDSHG